MLFSIYLASLIALSTGVEFKRSQPPLVKCRLFVYVDASPKGWIRLGPEDTLTAIGTKGPGSQTEFHDAQEFLWGGNDSDEESSTVCIIHISQSPSQGYFYSACLLTDCIS
jgi:hypothetical protein